MGQGKKKRGKQRKAAKSLLDSDDTRYECYQHRKTNELTMIKAPDGAYIHPQFQKLAALFVEKGDAAITDVMVDLIDEDLVPGRPNISLVQSGIVSTVLNFLGRCEHETFDMVMAGAKGNLFTPNGNLVSNVGGDLESPSMWIGVLVRAVELEPSCKLKIAENIGPLVSCICNDMTRLFFKSNKHWVEGIVRFSQLIGKMVHAPNWNDLDKKVVDALLQHEGLLTSIIQWGFWYEYRFDILNELSEVTNIVDSGRIIAKILVRDAHNRARRSVTTDGKDRLLMLGTTPIINKEYDPNCMVSYTEGLIHLAKRERGSTTCLDTLAVLINEAGCVDKGVIREMIDWGANYDHDVEKAEEFTRLLSTMICIELSVDKMEPNDTRAAFAVRTGLIEMCLRLAEQFGSEDETFKGDDGASILFMHRVISMINDVSFQEKTWKAISHKRSSIKETLVRLGQNTSTTNNPKCKKLLDMVRFIVNMNGANCCRCNKSLTRTEVKQCNGCHRMTYCSKACQRDDWLNGGHKLACCKSFTNETAGQFQGRIIPATPDDQRAAAKFKELEINSSMIQLKLLVDNSDTILSQAKELNLPLHDCVVVFDLRECPASMAVLNYSDYYRTSLEICNGFRETRSEKNITCFYYFPLSMSMRGLNESLFKMQKLYPARLINK